MRLTQLCSEARLRGAGEAAGPMVAGDAAVSRVILDSRRAQEGDCFVAVRGTATDGHGYIAQAVAAGCSAVVCEDATAVPPGTPHAVVAETRRAAGPLAQAIRGWPGRRLTTIGVTGTNGKTTFAYLLRHILRSAGHTPAMLGTVTYDTVARTVQASTTTPSPVELAGLMAEAADAGATHAIMEVSSHALDQHRVEGIEFDAAVFTNLTRDHLDYHRTVEQYAAAKRRLFALLAPDGTAVLNRDDDHAESMVEGVGAARLWYGLSAAARMRARIAEMGVGGSRFGIDLAGRTASVATSLIGRHNVYNCLAAAAAAVAVGVDLAAAADALGRDTVVPGRLQRVRANAPFNVLVDYAHTDDALKNVLAALAPLKDDGRLILVFGCGGDRDRTKRPAMARVAQDLADRIIVTSDNPRSEDPGAIIDEIVAGFDPEAMERVQVEPDRRRAIALGLGAAGRGDVVLIAGKGHENYQILGDRRV
ncbi:MAG: UDP-N-acetylmuramoyl-L-alanyl-D-glutamate--2,6-diaminopimelate ligase, partial [Planctomycetota bacterium]